MAKRLRNNSIPGCQKYTIADFHCEFPDDDACINHIFYARWPDGITVCDSPKCGNVERRHHRVTGRTAYACDYCGKHIYPLAGTIFEKTTTPLKLWFYAMYQMGSTRCGVSAKQIQRETGVTYKTAWRMFKQIRTLMSEDIKLEGSLVEMDETYVGGKRRSGRRGRPPAGDKKQTCVVGVVERKGRVVAIAANDATRKTLHGIAEERILPASVVYTDDLSAYHGLDKINGYQHKRINHSAGVYVVGDIHTNTIEGFWSLVKRGIGGVYHSVSKDYLQTYLDEYSFRYNRRNEGQPMFTSLLAEVSERAL
ncbi:MAG: IS1595 family transposase [Acidobacteriaceae bacterium]|jgi:transposase-like protein